MQQAKMLQWSGDWNIVYQSRNVQEYQSILAHEYERPFPRRPGRRRAEWRAGRGRTDRQPSKLQESGLYRAQERDRLARRLSPAYRSAARRAPAGAGLRNQPHTST